MTSDSNVLQDDIVRNSFHHQVDLPKSGISLHYVESGPKDGKPLVLLHGFPEFWLGWEKQIPFFASKSYRVLVPDLRGYGRSSAPLGIENYILKKLVGDLIELLDILSIPKATFIGHDWGGIVLWRIPVYFPERVTAVASVCTPYFPNGFLSETQLSQEELVEKNPIYYYQLYFATQAEKARAELEEDVEKTVKIFFRKSNERIGKFILKETAHLGFFGQYPKDSSSIPRSTLLSEEVFNAYVKEFKRTGYRAPLHYYATTELNYQAEQDIDPSSWVIRVPSLMINPENDAVLPPSLTKGMENHIPQLERKLISNAGHWVLHEQPDAINEAIFGWLESVSKVSSL